MTIQDFANAVFRGKSKGTNDWVIGSVFRYKANNKDCMAIITQGDGDSPCTFNEIEPDSLGMATGQRDCNGVEMFTGDVICSVDFDFDLLNEGAGIVLSDSLHCCDSVSFSVERYGYDDGLYCEDDCYTASEFSDWQVVGNVYDNPNLCEEILEDRAKRIKKYHYEKAVKELLARKPEEKVENEDGSWWERYTIPAYGVQWVYIEPGWTEEKGGFIATIDIEIGSNVNLCTVYGKDFKQWDEFGTLEDAMKSVEAKYWELYPKAN